MSLNSSGKKLLVELKNLAGTQGFDYRLKISEVNGAWLRPTATRRQLQDIDDVRCLTKWRNKHVTSFLTAFIATERQTSEWLSNIVGPDDGRILFMVDDDEEKVTIGYMGLALINWETGYCEADSIVRGISGRKGIMTMGLHTLLSWGKNQLGLNEFGVRVRSDNPAAMDFYRKNGFIEKKRIPLSCKRSEDKFIWYEDEKNLSSNMSIVYNIYEG